MIYKYVSEGHSFYLPKKLQNAIDLKPSDLAGMASGAGVDRGLELLSSADFKEAQPEEEAKAKPEEAKKANDASSLMGYLRQMAQRVDDQVCA